MDQVLVPSSDDETNNHGCRECRSLESRKKLHTDSLIVDTRSDTEGTAISTPSSTTSTSNRLSIGTRRQQLQTAVLRGYKFNPERRFELLSTSVRGQWAVSPWELPRRCHHQSSSRPSSSSATKKSWFSKATTPIDSNTREARNAPSRSASPSSISRQDGRSDVNLMVPDKVGQAVFKTLVEPPSRTAKLDTTKNAMSEGPEPVTTKPTLLNNEIFHLKSDTQSHQQEPEMTTSQLLDQMAYSSDEDPDQQHQKRAQSLLMAKKEANKLTEESKGSSDNNPSLTPSMVDSVRPRRVSIQDSLTKGPPTTDSIERLQDDDDDDEDLHFNTRDLSQFRQHQLQRHESSPSPRPTLSQHQQQQTYTQSSIQPLKDNDSILFRNDSTIPLSYLTQRRGSTSDRTPFSPPLHQYSTLIRLDLDSIPNSLASEQPSMSTFSAGNDRQEHQHSKSKLSQGPISNLSKSHSTSTAEKSAPDNMLNSESAPSRLPRVKTEPNGRVNKQSQGNGAKDKGDRDEEINDSDTQENKDLQDEDEQTSTVALSLQLDKDHKDHHDKETAPFNSGLSPVPPPTSSSLPRQQDEPSKISLESSPFLDLSATNVSGILSTSTSSSSLPRSSELQGSFDTSRYTGIGSSEPAPLHSSQMRATSTPSLGRLEYVKSHRKNDEGEAYSQVDQEASTFTTAEDSNSTPTRHLKRMSSRQQSQAGINLGANNLVDRVEYLDKVREANEEEVEEEGEEGEESFFTPRSDSVGHGGDAVGMNKSSQVRVKDQEKDHHRKKRKKSKKVNPSLTISSSLLAGLPSSGALEDDLQNIEEYIDQDLDGLRGTLSF